MSVCVNVCQFFCLVCGLWVVHAENRQTIELTLDGETSVLVKDVHFTSATWTAPIPPSGLGPASVVILEPHDACNSISSSASEQVCVAYRGSCTFWQKANMATEAGCLALLVVNNKAEALGFMISSEGDADIPVFMISYDHGAEINSTLISSGDVSIQMSGVPLSCPLSPLLSSVCSFS